MRALGMARADAVHELERCARRCAAACRGRRGTRARRHAARPPPPPSRPSPRVWRSWLCTPPGDSKPEHVQRRVAGASGVDGIGQHRIARELSVADRDVDPREILVDDAARADIEVADFGIAHLAFGKADAQLGGVDRRMRAGCEQLAPARRIGARDRVVGRVLAAAEAVEDQQHHRVHGRHGVGCAAAGEGEGVHANVAARNARVKLSFQTLSPTATLPSLLELEASSPGTGRSFWYSCISGAMLLWPLLQRRLSPSREIGTLDATRFINSENPLVLDVREPKEIRGWPAAERAAHPAVPIEGSGRRDREVHGASGDRLLRSRYARRGSGGGARAARFHARAIAARRRCARGRKRDCRSRNKSKWNIRPRSRTRA